MAKKRCKIKRFCVKSVFGNPSIGYKLQISCCTSLAFFVVAAGSPRPRSARPGKPVKAALFSTKFPRFRSIMNSRTRSKRRLKWQFSRLDAPAVLVELQQNGNQEGKAQ